MSIYICEDDIRIRQHINIQINKAIKKNGYSMKVVCESENPQIIINTLNPKQKAIYFLDVDLKNNNYNGFTLAEKIREVDPEGYIIFITIHSELTFETFRLHLKAMDYIVKDKENIKQRIEECLEIISLKNKDTHEGTSVIGAFDINDDINNIQPNDILYFEQYSRDKIILHTKENLIEFSGKINDISQKTDDSFLMISSKYLINRKSIMKVYLSNNTLELITGEQLLTSKKICASLIQK